MRTGPDPHRGGDLVDREEVAEFVTRFYREIAQDERFHPYFHAIAGVDWQAHTADLTDFWAAVVLDQPDRPVGRDADSVIEAHRWLDDRRPFDRELFDRWLEILDTTIDGGWSGPLADRVRSRGHGLAWAMAKRLAAIDLRAVDRPDPPHRR